jgi:hypothetical protein
MAALVLYGLYSCSKSNPTPAFQTLSGRSPSRRSLPVVPERSTGSMAAQPLPERREVRAAWKTLVQLLDG